MQQSITWIFCPCKAHLSGGVIKTLRICLLLEIIFIYLFISLLSVVFKFLYCHFSWISSCYLRSTLSCPTLLLTPPERNSDRIHRSIRRFLLKPVPRQNSTARNTKAVEEPYWLQHYEDAHSILLQSRMTRCGDLSWQPCLCDKNHCISIPFKQNIVLLLLPFFIFSLCFIDLHGKKHLYNTVFPWHLFTKESFYCLGICLQSCLLACSIKGFVWFM